MLYENMRKKDLEKASYIFPNLLKMLGIQLCTPDVNTIIQTKETPEENTEKRKFIFGFPNSAYMMHFRPFPPIFLLLAFFAKPSTSAALHKSYF